MCSVVRLKRLKFENKLLFLVANNLSDLSFFHQNILELCCVVELKKAKEIEILLSI